MENQWPLTRGKFSLVDPDIYTALVLLRRRWQLHSNGYAVSQVDGKGVYLHRWILKPDARIFIDHINGDKLDNRRENLRLVTQSENIHNQTKPTRAEIGFRGVRMIDGGNFAAYVNYDNKQVHLGSWPSARLAALARDQYVREHHPTAPLNFEKAHKYSEVARSKIQPKRNKHPGVRFKAGAWEAWSRADGKKVYLGRFLTEEEACKAQLPKI